MKIQATFLLFAASALCAALPAQKSFDEVAADVVKKLEAAEAELTKLREEITPEKVQLGNELSTLEEKRRALQTEFNDTTRVEDSGGVKIANLTTDIRSAEARATFLRGNLDEFRRKLGTRLHIAEMDRYETVLDAARLAVDNASLSETEVYKAQLDVLKASLDRLEASLGGEMFKGRAVDAAGVVVEGTFCVLGPAALFRSNDGVEVGLAEERLNSNEPTIAKFVLPEHETLAKEVFSNGRGLFPLDPTLGDATKIAATDETFLEHVQKGGMVMIPIFVMAALALLVALWKWISLSLVRRPTRKQIKHLLKAVEAGDMEEAQHKARALRGPIGSMLRKGADNLRQPRELIEEVMYEVVLKTRLKLQSMLPFIAICAASAPLLGLLGTVTGIINTFKLLTIFGSTDVKSLSGGISEALITTKFGLIVAIPSLLLHAYLSRKAKRIIGNMETSAIEFVNQVSKSPLSPDAGRAVIRADDELSVAPTSVDPALVREQVQEILGDMLGPIAKSASSGAASRQSG